MKYAAMAAAILGAAVGCGEGSGGGSGVATPILPANDIPTLWTAPDPVAAPQGLRAEAGDGRIQLFWTDLPNEQAYRIERSADEGQTWATIAWVPANTPAYTDSLPPAGSAHYRVRGWNGVIDGPPSIVAAPGVLPGVERLRLPAPGADNAIARFADGQSAIVTRDPVDGDLSLVVTAPGGSTLLDLGLRTAGTAGVALDANGEIYVAAYDVDRRELLLATNVGGAWEASTLLAAYGGVERPALRISPADGAKNVMAIRNDGQGGRFLEWLRSDGVSLTSETVVGDPSLGGFAYAMDPQGGHHLVYALGMELRYARRVGHEGWTVSSLPSSGSPDELAIAADGLGFVNVVYRDAAGGGLYRIGNEYGSWQNENLDAPGGRLPCVAMEAADGRLHLAYYDAAAGDLRYARKDVGAPWESFLIDAAGDVGRDPAIAVRDGIVSIAYRDASEGTLKIAVGAP